MKKIRLILVCAVALLTATACSDFLDITPEGQVGKDDLLSTDAGVEDALYGVYSQLREPGLYGRELTYSTTEVLAQYMDSYGNDNVEAMLNYQYDNTDVQSIFEEVWTQMYKNISNVNAVIGCDLLQGAESYPRCIYRGEALGLRAFMHFDLVRLFCKQYQPESDADGIPYATEFSLNTPAFSSVHKVYGYILADLHEAERLLANEKEHTNASSFMTDRNIHFNLTAVQATLARVYLTMGNTTEALRYARTVINESGLELMNNAEMTTDLNGMLYPKETIFGVYYADLFSEQAPLLQQTVSFSSLDPRDDMVEMYQGTDRRASLFFGSNVGDTRTRLMKLTDSYKVSSTTRPNASTWTPGVNLIRLPEMYYIAAECLLATDAPAATAMLKNVLDSRRVTVAGDWEVTQEYIDQERYKELIGEGQTFFNMKRRNLNITSVPVNGVTKTITASDKIYVVPIPEIETDYRK